MSKRDEIALGWICPAHNAITLCAKACEGCRKEADAILDALEPDDAMVSASVLAFMSVRGTGVTPEEIRAAITAALRAAKEG